MIFRLKFIIPLILIIACVVASFYFIKDAHLKSAIESQVQGLTLKEIDVSVSSEKVGIVSKGIIKDEETNDTLISWDEAEFNINPYPLGFKKFDSPLTSIKGVSVSSKLFKMAAKSVGDQVEISDKGEEGAEEGGLPKINIKSLDHEEILERVTGSKQLATERKLEELNKTYKEVEEKWKDIDQSVKKESTEIKSRIDTFKSSYSKGGVKTDFSDEINKLKERYQNVSKQEFNLKNVDQMVQSLNDIKNLKQDSKSLLEKVKASKNKIKEDIASVKKLKEDVKAFKTKYTDPKSDLDRLVNGVKEVRQASKDDVAMLKKELDPKNFDAAKITRLLLGKEWEEKFLYYSEIWYNIKEYLPSTGTGDEKTMEEKKEIEKLQKSSQPVAYVRNPDFAEWTLHKFVAAGQAEQMTDGEDVDFVAEVQNVTSNEKILGKPIEWDVNGKFKGGNGQFNITGNYSVIEKSSDKRWLNFKLTGRSMAGKHWGGKNTRVNFEKGILTTTVKFDLSQGEEVPGRGELKINDYQISIGEQVKGVIRQPLETAVLRVLEKPVPFQVVLRRKKMPKIKFGGDLDAIFKDALKGSLKSLAAEQSQLLTQKFNSQLESKIAEKTNNGHLQKLLPTLTGTLTGESSQLTSDLLGMENQNQDKSQKLNRSENLLGNLLGDLSGLQNSRESLQNELKNRLKDEAKKRLEEEARKRLLGEGEGDSKEELKNKSDKELSKLKDKLKIKF